MEAGKHHYPVGKWLKDDHIRETPQQDTHCAIAARRVQRRVPGC